MEESRRIKNSCITYTKAASEVPRVSIILALYNSCEYISRCLESLLNQTYKKFQLIVVDDASSDESIKVLKRFISGFPDMCLLEKFENCGVSAARNDGLSLATGDYIRFIDADDELPNDSLEKLAEYSSGQDMVMGSVQVIDPAGNFKLTASSRIYSNVYPHLVPQEVRYNLLSGITACLIRRKLLLDVGVKFSHKKSRSEDTTFLGELFFHLKKVSLIPDIVYNYIKREGSLSDIKFKDPEVFVDICSRWVNFIQASAVNDQQDFAIYAATSAFKN